MSNYQERRSHEIQAIFKVLTCAGVFARACDWWHWPLFHDDLADGCHVRAFALNTLSYRCGHFLSTEALRKPIGLHVVNAFSCCSEIVTAVGNDYYFILIKSLLHCLNVAGQSNVQSYM